MTELSAVEAGAVLDMRPETVEFWIDEGIAPGRIRQRPYRGYEYRVDEADLDVWRYELARVASSPHVSPPDTTRSNRGYVYLIQAADGTGHVKIGSSFNPRRRFRVIQMHSPVVLVLLGTLPGGAWLEAHLHARYAMWRAHGEWFRADAPGLSDLISQSKTPSRWTPRNAKAILEAWGLVESEWNGPKPEDKVAA